MQTRKEAIQSVLEEQDRQRRCNHFDPVLIAKTSRQHSMISTERARRLDIPYMRTRVDNSLTASLSSSA